MRLKKSSLVQNLKLLCKERNLSLAKLADAARVPKATVHSWTVGASPNLEQLKRVSEVLEISVHQLAFGEPDPFEGTSSEILKEIFSGDIRVTLHKIEKGKK